MFLSVGVRLLALGGVAVNCPIERLYAPVRLRGGKRFAFSSPQTPHLLREISRDKELLRA